MIDGIIIKAISGFYYVDDGDTVYECKSRGIMKKDGVTPCVGDNAAISVGPSAGGKHIGVVERIGERRNLLKRPPVANVDRLYIISSFENPAPNTLIIDKLICSCEAKGIEPAVVFNKSDMGSFENIADIYRKCGLKRYIIPLVLEPIPCPA